MNKAATYPSGERRNVKRDARPAPAARSSLSGGHDPVSRFTLQRSTQHMPRP